MVTQVTRETHSGDIMGNPSALKMPTMMLMKNPVLNSTRVGGGTTRATLPILTASTSTESTSPTLMVLTGTTGGDITIPSNSPK